MSTTLKSKPIGAKENPNIKGRTNKKNSWPIQYLTGLAGVHSVKVGGGGFLL
tara:strand:- start:9619 stop:9774 length:156 start_codon:yes stop_codon:yes gene_type:complete